MVKGAGGGRRGGCGAAEGGIEGMGRGEGACGGHGEAGRGGGGGGGGGIGRRRRPWMASGV
jgi:hypothetical protein